MQQVVVGFETMEMIKDMELNSPSGIGFGIEEGISEVEDEKKGGEDEGEEDKDDEVCKFLLKSSFCAHLSKKLNKIVVTLASGMDRCSRRWR